MGTGGMVRLRRVLVGLHFFALRKTAAKGEGVGEVLGMKPHNTKRANE